MVAFLCSSCDFSIRGSGNIAPGEYEDHLTSEIDYIANFSNGFPNGFHIRNDRGNGSPFNCAFSSANVTFSNGSLNLSLTKTNSGYAGGEFRSNEVYGYGFYSTLMKPAKCSGVISSFFTYIGWPSWHEIDIEFLGNNTNIVQFNHYTNGVGGHEYYYELGFDASLEYHEYGFSWNKNTLVYYVDGVAVYKTTASIPSVSGRIMMNIWNVHDSYKGWAGKFDDSKLPVTSSYKWIGYQAFNT